MILQRLSEAHGVSGHEEEVRSIILEEIRGRVEECRVDAVGNLISRRKGSGGRSSGCWPPRTWTKSVS